MNVRNMSLRLFLPTIYFLTYLTGGNQNQNKSSTLIPVDGTACFGDGMEFALRHKNCEKDTIKNIQNTQKCTDLCYYGLLPTRADCQHWDNNSTIHNIQIQFSVDAKRMIHSYELCANKDDDSCTYNLSLICNTSIVNENSDIESVCLGNSHCSSKHHLFCNRFNKSLEMGKYGICKCDQGYIEWNGRCIKDHLPLGRFCRHSVQCQGHDNWVACLQDSQGRRKRCRCKPNYVKIEGNCVEANLTLHTACQFSAHCAYGKSVTACVKDSFGQKRCQCTDGYLEYKNNCLKTERKVNQSCSHESQCNGTVNAQICFRNRCFCDFGYVQSKEKCVKELMPSASEEIFPLAASLSGGLIIGLVLSAIVSCVLMTKKTKQYSKRKRILSNNSNALLLSRKYSEHSTEMEIYHSIEEPEMEEKAKTTNRYQQQSSLGTGNGCFDPNTAEREKSPENWVQSERPHDVSNIVALPSENGANRTTENNDYFTLEKMEC